MLRWLATVQMETSSKVKDIFDKIAPEEKVIVRCLIDCLIE